MEFNSSSIEKNGIQIGVKGTKFFYCDYGVRKKQKKNLSQDIFSFIFTWELAKQD